MKHEYGIKKLLRRRFSILPRNHKYDFAYDLYKKQVASFWTVEEIDFSNDYEQFNKLTKSEQNVIKNILAFFASSDGIVSMNLSENFMSEFDGENGEALEVTFCYQFQCMMENIHNEAYSALIELLIPENEQNKCFNAILELESVKKKALWTFKYTNPETCSKAKRLVAFTVIEGILFSASFVYFHWLKNRNTLDGSTILNEFISRDEGLHFMFGVQLYHSLNDDEKITKEEISEVVLEGGKCEEDFVSEIMPDNLYNMNKSMMIQYLRYITDFVLSCYECDKVFKVEQPFDFMETIALEQKTNFFESRNSSYAKANVNGKQKTEEINCSYEEIDF